MQADLALQSSQKRAMVANGSKRVMVVLFADNVDSEQTTQIMKSGLKSNTL